MIFGSEFSGMYNLMVILLPGYVCLGVMTLMNSIYIGKGNIRRIFFGDMLGLVFVFVLNRLFVPEYGAMAAAMISSLAYCLVFLYLYIGFKKQFLLPAKISL
jgi:O-antigen/teichoic acid export membrane protein